MSGHTKPIGQSCKMSIMIFSHNENNEYVYKTISKIS